jgi:outer membrane protein OmpA-like peptidoglycan-associated protein
VLLKAPYERVLSTGYRVKGATDGVESRLIGFLEDPRRKIDETTWFTFDRLSFVQNGSELDLQGSRSQLDNVAQILGAYPAAKLVIGGYTDNAGPAAAGKKRSQQQAQAVKQALVQTGVAAPRLGAEGFGAANPLCAANDSEACKAQNRRIAARVTAK